MYNHTLTSTSQSLKSILPFILLMLSFSFLGFSQDDATCGTTIDATNTARLIEYNEQWINRASNEELKAYSGTTYFVPVQLHLIRDDSGLGGISEADALAALDRMNEYYIDASIHFYQCGGINLINSTTYFDYDKSQMYVLDAEHSQANVVNIYVANTTSSSGSLICGHAEFPGGLDFMMIATSCMKNGSTLAHEMGHYLGLYHTHTSTFGNEAVDGSDCATQGDLICDTPADPNLSGDVNNDGCIYEGTSLDENGQTYTPSVTNLMSYTSKECRYEVTEEQLSKALWTLQNQRTYLNCTPPSLEANFYVRAEESCLISKQFSFYNISQGSISSYNWDFGDGIGTSNAQSPNYVYWANGIYTVTLTVSNGSSSQTYSQKVVVGEVTLPYFNDFEAGTASLDQFVTSSSMKNEVVAHADAAESGSFGLLLHGTDEDSNSPTFQTPNATESFQELWNPYYKSSAKLCVDATYYTGLQLEFDKRQLRTSNDNYTHFMVTINGQQEGAVIQVNSSGSDDPDFTHLTYDLSAYDNQMITIGFEGTHRYHKDRNGTDNGTATFIDNISISGVLTTDEVELNELVIYPNPAENSISLRMNNLDFDALSIVDMLGKSVKQLTKLESINGNVLQVNISGLNSGTYFIRTKNGMKRFVKK